jgi:hypothetical protein
VFLEAYQKRGGISSGDRRELFRRTDGGMPHNCLPAVVHREFGVTGKA